MFYKIVFWIAFVLIVGAVLFWLVGMLGLCSAFRPSDYVLHCLFNGP
jgi:hypothetical protein